MEPKTVLHAKTYLVLLTSFISLMTKTNVYLFVLIATTELSQITYVSNVILVAICAQEL